jgi:hypothetical protein
MNRYAVRQAALVAARQNAQTGWRRNVFKKKVA